MCLNRCRNQSVSHSPSFSVHLFLRFCSSFPSSMSSTHEATQGAACATASADRALWKCQCPYPRGLPANALKATIKIIQQCWVPRGIGENSLSLVPQPAQHTPRVSQSLLFRQLSALDLTPFLTRTQNQPKMLNRCHPIAQHELWFQ